MITCRLAAFVVALSCGWRLSHEQAHATDPPAPLAELARGADLIVEGRVIAVTGVRIAGFIYSDVTVAIDTTIKAGGYDAPTITFRTLGGTIGTETYSSVGQELLYGNERVIVLLIKLSDEWWLFEPGRCVIIGEGSVADRVLRAVVLEQLKDNTTASVVAPSGWGDIKDRR